MVQTTYSVLWLAIFAIEKMLTDRYTDKAIYNQIDNADIRNLNESGIIISNICGIILEVALYIYFLRVLAAFGRFIETINEQAKTLPTAERKKMNRNIFQVKCFNLILIVSMILATMVQVLAPWANVLRLESLTIQRVFNVTQSVFYFVNMIYSCLLLYVFFIFG